VKSIHEKDSEDIYIIEFEGDSIEKNNKSWIIKIKQNATNLFEDFNPFPPNNGNKKSVWTQGADLMKP
jgi:hypothetical protein